jgi:hypothetical protein
MVEISMKHYLKEHVFYKEKSINAKEDLKEAKQEMEPELYEIFCEVVIKVFEKWTSLYEAALQSPEAFNELNRQCSMGKGSFKQLEKRVNSGECSDELTRKYVEANKYITYADKWYTHDFAIRIEFVAVSIAVFIDKAVAKKIHLKEINEKWKKIYPEEGQLDEIEEPPRKRLKRTEQNEETTSDKQEESVSCRFFSR